MDARTVLLTLELAAATTAVLLLLGLPIAHWLATTRSRWRFLVEALVAMPLVLPPTVLGFYVLLVTGPDGWLGRLMASTTGQRLPFTFAGILIGSVLFNLPFAVRPFAAALGSIEPRLLEASATLGASRLWTFWRVALPLAWPGILAGMVLTFAHAVGEFGVVLMVGGNIPGVTRTLSIAIYDEVQALDYAAAGSTAAWLAVSAFAMLCVVQVVNRRSLVA